MPTEKCISTCPGEQLGVAIRWRASGLRVFFSSFSFSISQTSKQITPEHSLESSQGPNRIHKTQLYKHLWDLQARNLPRPVLLSSTSDDITPVTTLTTPSRLLPQSTHIHLHLHRHLAPPTQQWITAQAPVARPPPHTTMPTLNTIALPYLLTRRPALPLATTLSFTTQVAEGTIPLPPAHLIPGRTSRHTLLAEGDKETC